MPSSSSAPSSKNDESFGIVPFKRNKGDISYLVIQHNAGHWGFPKGHAEAGETPLHAAVREFSEETGLSIAKILETAPLQEVYSFYHNKVLIHKVVHYFLAEVTGDLFLQEKEISDAKWCNFAEAYALLTFQGCKKLLEEAHSKVDVVDEVDMD
jgi:bis(5'-nucleosidyl)-tetraphosphatase